jgi:hypothetical protein
MQQMMTSACSTASDIESTVLPFIFSKLHTEHTQSEHTHTHTQREVND